MNKFYVIINNAHKDSWPNYIWNDIKDCATIFLDNNSLSSLLLRKIKAVHFSNKLNSKIWIPMKKIWNKALCLQLRDLDSNDRNYLIFQSNVKFSPEYIRRLKKEKNASIILYLPDTVQGIGIGNSLKAVKRYKDYYQIDYIFSFDKNECKKYGFIFFDVYSKLTNNLNNLNEEEELFYVGSCRNDERRRQLIGIFKTLRETISCDFYLANVSYRKQMFRASITYNNFLTYGEVVKMTRASKFVLELINGSQSGNTLRFKEAICYNKKLLTNNKSVLHSKYYDSRYIQYFSDIGEINTEWFRDKSTVDYKYKDEFSPINLLKLIVKNDME